MGRVVRPDRLAFITGTGTEVGKTWVAAATVRRLRDAGLRVAVRKPAQSYAPGAGPTDAEVLAEAAAEAPGAVCPRHRWYPVPLAPVMAAAASGQPTFTIDQLVSELAWPPDTVLGLVEGAGGLRSPLAADGDNLSYALALAPDLVVVVAGPALGAINAVRLTVDALARVGPVVVYLNRFDSSEEVHCLNRDWLVERDGYAVVTEVADLAARLAGDVESGTT